MDWLPRHALLEEVKKGDVMVVFSGMVRHGLLSREGMDLFVLERRMGLYVGGEICVGAVFLLVLFSCWYCFLTGGNGRLKSQDCFYILPLE